MVNGVDTVVAAGGFEWLGTNTLVKYVDFFTISNESWSQAPDLVSARRNMHSVVIDGLFYFWGGKDISGVVADGFRMLSDGTWEAVSEAMSVAAEGGYAVVHHVPVSGL